MTKEEVLALCINDAQKERVEASYMVGERFKKTPLFEPMTDAEKVKEKINSLVVNYEKRLKAKEKSKERRMKKKATVDQFTQLLSNANEANVDNDDLIFAVKKVIKEKYNQHILEEIEELRKKMME